VCGLDFPGGGLVEIDRREMLRLLQRGFDGMNVLFTKHGFDEQELEWMSRGLVDVLGLDG
jgi:hypothetical protein